jgi:CobQ-like glutamine amidotransferase family enzyme
VVKGRESPHSAWCGLRPQDFAVASSASPSLRFEDLLLVEEHLKGLAYLVALMPVIREYETMRAERTPENPLGRMWSPPGGGPWRPRGAGSFMLCSGFGRQSTRIVPWILRWGHEHEGSYAVRRIRLTIHHLYADMMNLYGDRGNVISIKKRCEWRGIPVEVVDVGLAERIRPTGCDLFLFGGGQDREQALLAEDLSGSKGADLRAIVEDGGVVLGVCGGYQLMGHYYETPEGEKLSGVGIFDLHTEPRMADEERLIGNVLVRVQAPKIGETREIVGFENHGGRTYLGEDLKPLGEIVVGYGNNGKDGTEGARRLNAYGTYLHGSLLPKNPWLTDQLILNALRRVDETFELEPLDDAIEGRAFSSVAGHVAGRWQG